MHILHTLSTIPLYLWTLYAWFYIVLDLAVYDGLSPGRTAILQHSPSRRNVQSQMPSVIKRGEPSVKHGMIGTTKYLYRRVVSEPVPVNGAMSLKLVKTGPMVHWQVGARESWGSGERRARCPTSWSPALPLPRPRRLRHSRLCPSWYCTYVVRKSMGRHSSLALVW